MQTLHLGSPGAGASDTLNNILRAHLVPQLHSTDVFYVLQSCCWLRQLTLEGAGAVLSCRYLRSATAGS